MTVIDLAKARAARIKRDRAPAQMLGYAVVDLETTGLRPGGYDRVVEIAIVRLDRELNETDAWTTLVDPQRDIGSRAIHGISALQVLEAPTFAEIAGDVLLRLANMVVVGHNVAFDLSFLRAEFARCGWEVPGWDGLCTLELSAVVGTSGSRSLEACCRDEGIPHEDAHTAAGDARAAAELLRRYLSSLKPHELNALTPSAVDPRTLPQISPSGKARLRTHVPAALAGSSSLESLVARLPGAIPAVEADPTSVLAYVDLLDRVVEDRSISADEAAALAEFAVAHELGQDIVADIHRSYLTSLVAIALRDGEVTEVERDDLSRVATLLGSTELLEALLRAAGSIRTALAALRGLAHAVSPTHSPVPPIDRRTEFRGKTVCFTGESVCDFDRETQELLAAGAGLIVMPSVTRRLDILVLADPASQSTKRKKAESYGIRMIAERSFWPALGIAID